MANGLIVQPRSLIVPRRGFRKPARPVLDPSDPINRGRVRCWPLGYNVSGIASDISPFNATGTLVASPPLVSSHHGGLSNSFNGSTRYVSTTLKSGLTTATQRFSIAAWINPATNGSTGGVIASTAINTSPFDGIWFQYGTGFGSGTTNSIIFGFLDTIPTSLFGYTASGTVPTSTWSFVVATFDGSNANAGIKLYVNSVSKSLTTGGTGTLSTSYTNRAWYIAAATDASNSFNGSMDGVSVFNRVLTATEIARLYAEPYAGIIEAGPRWRVGSAAAATFNPGWAYGATRTIGGVW